jgi:hypothetical protein
MAPTIVTTFAKKQLRKATSYVKGRALHEYNEAALKFETNLWMAKVCSLSFPCHCSY